ncbi:hypothetical protein SLEP1_g6969 [Rubroshorea leprosula]|uniref:phosphoinositide phospholipase C n=1 Tax=Rubroshorea leprosula TaxID=152421 RepID=A0AAV5I383_9ROSI|nr:hypothetical protein SLEP1_g6969 [Rubroshorea leprosula]
MGSYRVCVFFTRKFRIVEPEPPEDVKDAFREYAEGGKYMTAVQLQRFLVDFQGEVGASLAHAEQIVKQALQRHHITKFARHNLHLEDFHHYLFSADLNSPIGDQVLCVFLLSSSKCMFRSNGGCGYLKKPELLMNVGPDGQVFDPKAELKVQKTLKVKVYMGDGWHLDFKQTHFDSYSPPDFFTRVGIEGVPADKKMFETKIKEDKWSPVWDEEFKFELTVPELALLRVEVLDYDMSETNDFGGQTCLLVSELKQGIRAVPLYYKKGEKLNNARLLMRFDFV